MSPETVALLALGPGFVAGYVGHELAHYAPLVAAGRDASLSLWPPRVEFQTPEPAPAVVRLAAGAPALVGLAILALSLPWLGEAAVFGAVVGACSRLLWLSPQDRSLAFRGQVRTR